MRVISNPVAQEKSNPFHCPARAHGRHERTSTSLLIDKINQAAQYDPVHAARQEKLQALQYGGRSNRYEAAIDAIRAVEAQKNSFVDIMRASQNSSLSAQDRVAMYREVNEKLGDLQRMISSIGNIGGDFFRDLADDLQASMGGMNAVLQEMFFSETDTSLLHSGELASPRQMSLLNGSIEHGRLDRAEMIRNLRRLAAEHRKEEGRNVEKEAHDPDGITTEELDQLLALEKYQELNRELKDLATDDETDLTNLYPVLDPNLVYLLVSDTTQEPTQVSDPTVDADLQPLT